MSPPGTGPSNWGSIQLLNKEFTGPENLRELLNLGAAGNDLADNGDDADGLARLGCVAEELQVGVLLAVARSNSDVFMIPNPSVAE